jgi:two-component system nitrogen regulation response regulator GlnG
LYDRLNVVRIRMPALRERADDIPQIVDFCLQNLVKQRKARVAKVSPEAMTSSLATNGRAMCASWRT